MIKFRLAQVMANNKEKPLRMKDVCKMTGLWPAAVSRVYWNKVERMDMETLNKLCQALNCTPGDLIEYIPDPQDKKPQIQPRKASK